MNNSNNTARANSNAPFKRSANNIIQPTYNQQKGANDTYYHSKMMENPKENMSNNDNGIVSQLKAENNRLKMELTQKNKIIEDYKVMMKNLEKKNLTLKNQLKTQTKCGKSSSTGNVRGIYEMPYDDPMMQFTDPFGMMGQVEQMARMCQREPMFLPIYDEHPQNLPDDYYVDPVKEVEQHLMNEICPDPDAMTYEQLLALEDKVGSVSKGLNSAQINKIPMILFTKKEYKADDKCVVCQYEFKHHERVRKLACNHLFHKDCVDEWLLKDKTCPCCKKDARYC